MARPQETTIGQAAGEATASAAMISARLDRLPVTWTGLKITILLSLGFFFELYGLLSTAYLAPGLMRSGIFSLSTPGLFGTSGIASFVAALFFGLFIGTSVCGFLADKYGRRSVFMYSLLWFMATNLIMAFQNTAFSINCWRFLIGLGIGVEMVTIGTFLSEIAPKHLRGRSFAFCQAVGFTAVPIVAVLSYLLVPRAPFGIEGWRWVVIIGAFGGLYAWWARRRLPESPRWLALQGRFDEAEAVMAELESKVAAESGRPLPAPVMPRAVAPILAHSGFRDLWVPPHRKWVIMLVLFNIFQTIGYFGFASWVPTLVIQQGITVTQSLFYTSIIAIAAPLGPVIGLFIGDRYERKTVICVMALFNVVCGLAFAYSRNPAAIMAMGICLTLSGNIISYTYHAYQAEVFPTAIRARAIGFVYSWSRLSAIFNAFLIAFFLKAGGVLGVFLFIGAAYLVVILVIGLVGPRTRNVAIEEIAH